MTAAKTSFDFWNFTLVNYFFFISICNLYPIDVIGMNKWKMGEIFK